MKWDKDQLLPKTQKQMEFTVLVLEIRRVEDHPFLNLFLNHKKAAFASVKRTQLNTAKYIK